MSLQYSLFLSPQKSNVGRQTQRVAWYQLGGFRTPVVAVLHHIPHSSSRGRCDHNLGQSTFQVVAGIQLTLHED